MWKFVLNGIVIIIGVFNGVKFNKKKCNVVVDMKLYIKCLCFLKIFCNWFGKNIECGTIKMRFSGTFFATNSSVFVFDGVFFGYFFVGSVNFNYGVCLFKCEI